MVIKKKLLRAPEVAKIMGLSLRAVYRLSESKKIPFVKWGKAIRYDLADVEAFINANKHYAYDD